MTPFEKVEKNVRQLGDIIEKNLKVMTDPKVSELRAVFQGVALVVRGRNLQVRICKSLGLSQEVHPHSLEDFHLLIETMEGKGSNAADKLKKLLPDIQKMIDAVEAADATGRPFQAVRACRKAANP